MTTPFTTEFRRALNDTHEAQNERATALKLVTVYVIVLFAVPSYLRLSALGSLGKPAILLGLGMLLWWTLTRLMRRHPDPISGQRPIVMAFAGFVVIALLSFAAAMLRGQPGDQISPAFTAMILIASWAGVLLVTMEGLGTADAVHTLLRRLVMVATAFAALGIVQSLLGMSLLGWVEIIPGFETEDTTAFVRDGFFRAAGTGTHPLEFTTAVASVLPLAIVVASAASTANRRLIAWASVAVFLVAGAVSVSRSAMIGLAVATLASIPLVPRKARLWAVGGAFVLGLIVVFTVPGIARSTLRLFTGARDDSSTQSRLGALRLLPDFVEPSPLIGIGFGTFLPRYYIFDNEWVQTLIELGVLGLLALAALVLTGILTGLWTARNAPQDELRRTGGALAGSLLTISTLFLFFDGFSFGITAGLFFLMLGLAGASRTAALRAAATRLGGGFGRSGTSIRAGTYR